MKDKHNILVWLVVFFMGTIQFNSCTDDFKVGDSFLEKQPGVDMNLDSIFSKAEYARYFLWDTYTYMYSAFDKQGQSWESSVFEPLSDCWHSTLGWDDLPVYYSGTYSAGMESDWIRGRFTFLGNHVWQGIRSGWLFIENVDRVPDMSPEEKARLKAEAKIIIASRYFDLLRHVGGLPIVDHAYTTNEAFESPRETIENTVKFVVNLLDEAAATPSLPWRIPDNEIENWTGRLTKASAMGLKCKVLLYAASPIFNDNKGYTDEQPQEAVELKQVWYGEFKQSLWDDCKEACIQFFQENSKNGNYYQLIEPVGNTEADYKAAYRKGYWTRGNSEKVIEVHDRYKLNEWQPNLIGNVSHFGATAPTLEYMEMFPWKDGKPYDGNKVYGTTNPDNLDIFENRDPRLYETLLVQKKGFMWQNKQIEIWEGGNIQTNVSFGKNGFMAHGLAMYKWVLDYWNMGNEPFQWPYLRMAEMHLIYAEALAETGNLSEACAHVNRVRSRVGLGKIETCNPSLNLTSNKENLIQEILRERACELGMEDTRLLDMVRRKLVRDFTKPLHGIKVIRKAPNGSDKNEPLKDSDEYPSFRYEKYPITQYARVWWQEGYWTNKWFLSAMPRSEINKDYGLNQNPGW